MKQVISIILMLTMILTAVSGCGQRENDKSNKETAEYTSQDSNVEDKSTTDDKNVEQDWISAMRDKWYVGKDITFDWYLNYSWWNHNKPWTEYTVLKDISDITGVVPNVSIPSGDGTEKLNLMIATNDLPDMITLDISDKNVNKLINQGLVYSYDELIEEYCPEFMDEIPEEVYRYTKSDIDGKLYGLPSWFVPDLMPNNASAYNVRKDIYEELGSPDMTTIDGFKGALLAFKEKYPTIDGKNSIPLSLGENYGSRSIVEKSFGIREYYEDSSQNLLHRYKDPKYIEFVKFINDLYREGLLDQEGYVKKRDQIKEDEATRVFCTAAGWWGLNDANAALDARKPGSHYIVTDSLNAPGEKFEVGQSKLGWTISLITKSAEDPGEILKFTRYLWSPDGNKLLEYGHEGEDFVIEDNKVIRSEKYLEEWNKDKNAFYEKTGVHTFRFFQYSYWDNALYGAFTEEPDRANNRALANTYVKYDATPFTYEMNPDPTTAEGIIMTQVEEVIEKEYPKIIMAKSESEAIEAYYDMIEKMDKVGLPQLEDWWSEKYKSNLEKFSQ